MAEPAVKQWQRAAELAIGRSANIEAIAHCDQAEAELRALPPSPERARTELEVQLTKGVAVRAAKGFSAPEMEPLFRRACELCEQLGDRLRLVYALRGLWVLYYAAGRWQDLRGAAMSDPMVVGMATRRGSAGTPDADWGAEPDAGRWR